MVVAERRVLFGSMTALIHARRQLTPEGAFEQLQEASGASAHGLFSRPYVNVVRMHLLIIFFGIGHWLKLDSFPIYVAVYSVYFFPWSALRKTAGEAPPAGCASPVENA